MLANTDMEDEAAVAFGLGAEGIGLFRSEFVYMGERRGPVPFQAAAGRRAAARAGSSGPLARDADDATKSDKC